MNTSAKSLQPVSRWSRVRAVCAVIAVAGILTTAVAAPMTMSTPALADESFYDRIHQEFVPEESVLALDVSVSPLEHIPEPEPEPVPVPASATTPTARAAAAAPPMYPGGGSPAEWMAAAGIPEGDWGFVDFIVKKESGWNPNATNSSSGACGLVQAYPCSKVPGSGYDPVANLTWANGYAVGRYGSWSQAYGFWTSNNWW